MCLGTGQRGGGRRLPWTNKRRDPSFLAEVVVKGERMLRFLLVGQENLSTSDFEDHFFSVSYFITKFLVRNFYRSKRFRWHPTLSSSEDKRFQNGQKSHTQEVKSALVKQATYCMS